MNSVICTAMLIVALYQRPVETAKLKAGEGCLIGTIAGICKPFKNCTILEDAYKHGTFLASDAVHCGYTAFAELICCPNEWTASRIATEESITATNKRNRPSVAICNRIESLLANSLSQHIINGLPAQLGEFPHAVLIQFNDDDIICGGSLIDTRFVLTVAHCVISQRRLAQNVRIGIINLNDSNQGITIPIKEYHIHDDYVGSSKYNDIAIIELQRDAFTWDTVTWSTIGPVCLYTDAGDPPPHQKLRVIGWGVTNVTTRTTSSRLLKVDLNITDSNVCNAEFTKTNRSNLSRGIIDSQICAYGTKKDSCSGDSGGPLNVVIDADTKLYKVFGIVSTGLSCATTIPGLYTRVSSYLDFIEQIVWPNGVNTI